MPRETWTVQRTCECVTLHDRAAHAACRECGTAGCVTCAITIGPDTYCRSCATGLAPIEAA